MLNTSSAFSSPFPGARPLCDVSNNAASRGPLSSSVTCKDDKPRLPRECSAICTNGSFGGGQQRQVPSASVHVVSVNQQEVSGGLAHFVVKGVLFSVRITEQRTAEKVNVHAAANFELLFAENGSQVPVTNFKKPPVECTYDHQAGEWQCRINVLSSQNGHALFRLRVKHGGGVVLSEPICVVSKRFLAFQPPNVKRGQRKRYREQAIKEAKEALTKPSGVAVKKLASSARRRKRHEPAVEELYSDDEDEDEEWYDGDEAELKRTQEEHKKRKLDVAATQTKGEETPPYSTESQVSLSEELPSSKKDAFISTLRSLLAIYNEVNEIERSTWLVEALQSNIGEAKSLCEDLNSAIMRTSPRRDEPLTPVSPYPVDDYSFLESSFSNDEARTDDYDIWLQQW